MDDGAPARTQAAAAVIAWKDRRPGWRKFAIVGGIAFVAVAGALFAWSQFRPPITRILEVVPTTVEKVLAVVGRVQPHRTVQIKSLNAGEIARVLRREGDRVEPGEPLAIVRSAVERAQVAVNAGQLQAARTEAARARQAYDRTRTLADKGFATRAALIEATATLQRANAAVSSASAAARASVAHAGEFTVRAPMRGVVLARLVDDGQIVSPATELFELGSVGDLEIEAEVDEAYGDIIHTGMAVRAVVSGADAAFNASVTEVAPRIDASTGGRVVRIALDAGLALAPGRSVDVTIVVARKGDVITVPRRAIFASGRDQSVYVVDADGYVRLRLVKIENWPSVDAIVESGLARGDRVVAAPAERRPAQKVRAIADASGEGK
jgi:RND family efflux transporter MFP subunit